MRALLGLVAVLSIPVWGEGLKARPSPVDYAASDSAKDGTVIAATPLKPSEVKKLFSTDLNRGWMVLEVAVYPPQGENRQISPGDFMLYALSGEQRTLLRSATPRSIAGVLQRDNREKADADVTLHPSVGVGYETGPSYDPVTGTRRRGGWNTGAGVGVDLGGANRGPAPPVSTAKDRETMQAELEDGALPEGKITRPAAGYVYFPLPSKKVRVTGYELVYETSGQHVKLALPK